MGSVFDVTGAEISALNEKPLKDLEKYWHCEVRDASSGTDLLRALNHPGHLISAQDFRDSLAAAIERRSFSVAECESVTGLDFESADEVAEDLKDRWKMMHGL